MSNNNTSHNRYENINDTSVHAENGNNTLDANEVLNQALATLSRIVPQTTAQGSQVYDNNSASLLSALAALNHSISPPQQQPQQPPSFSRELLQSPLLPLILRSINNQTNSIDINVVNTLLANAAVLSRNNASQSTNNNILNIPQNFSPNPSDLFALNYLQCLAISDKLFSTLNEQMHRVRENAQQALTAARRRRNANAVQNKRLRMNKPSHIGNSNVDTNIRSVDHAVSNYNTKYNTMNVPSASPTIPAPQHVADDSRIDNTLQSAADPLPAPMLIQHPNINSLVPSTDNNLNQTSDSAAYTSILNNYANNNAKNDDDSDAVQLANEGGTNK